MSNQRAATRELRRRVRAPYRVPARLEIIGVTAQGEGWPVMTYDANPWGARFASDAPSSSASSSSSAPPPLPPLPQVNTPVVLALPAPDGRPLRLIGWIIHSRPLGPAGPGGGAAWEAGVEFDRPHTSLATTLIDLSRYGT